MIKILMVEDDTNITNTLTYYLQNEGFLMETAKSKYEAIEKIDQKEYNLILLDITLPDGNGYEVYKKLKEKY